MHCGAGRRGEVDVFKTMMSGAGDGGVEGKYIYGLSNGVYVVGV